MRQEARAGEDQWVPERSHELEATHEAARDAVEVNERSGHIGDESIAANYHERERGLSPVQQIYEEVADPWSSGSAARPSRRLRCRSLAMAPICETVRHRRIASLRAIAVWRG